VVISARDDDNEAEAVTRDISVGGVFVELPPPTPFLFGQRVFVWVRFPGTHVEMPLPATVRWIDQGGMGLQFQPMGARATHEITEIVRAS